ncbi:patatin [Virgisporangium aliadipatigenens]|uniref:Patatin n=1 Tax=Virgisporangium aliadipatigenens TaxID=741659 RepID=A0A8J4DRX5_9ACTN|nr:patatin-like phospholipase family protein [Virgisporangium aliadipatigenens]GIJ46737.1 patatin [Virgisporangium aliadipatigenens]
MVNALVLGAGGITGIAWQLGVLVGLRAEGVDLTTADLFVGTSAGAVTGALVAGGHTPEEAARIEARLGADDPPFRPDWARGAQAFALLNDATLDAGAIRAAVGGLALAADVVGEEEYVASLARRIPTTDWPSRLRVTAVNATTGEPVVWDAGSRVPLQRAVAASCAVPCVFPPVTVNGGRFMDGGVRSGVNADLAHGAARVVILAPLAPVRTRAVPEEEIAALRATARVTLVAPDAPTLRALGPNVLDPSRWEPAVAAGTAQGARLAASVASTWAS